MYYSSIGMLAIILHLIINIDHVFSRPNVRRVKVAAAYRYFLLSVLLYYLSDACWGVLLDLGIIPLVYADTVIYFLSMGLTVLLWVSYIALTLELDKKWGSILKGVGWVIFGSEALALIINFFVPIMFWFTPEGEYKANSARYVILYVQVVLFTCIAFDTLIKAKRLNGPEKSHHNAIGISGAIMAVFIVLQAQFPLMPFYAVGCLLATSIIHTFVVIEARIEGSRQLGMVMTVAYKDPLTSVRNVNSYTEFKENIEVNIRNGKIREFAVVVFDLNDLKYVNDNLGHEAGDKYIKDGCTLICKTFTHSPVFRIGGDEFAAFLTNEDYNNRDELIYEFNSQVEDNLTNGGAVVSAGISVYDAEKDSGYDEVFARADVLMYDRKKELKAKKYSSAGASRA
ncbi:MAG: GGDEF domain-containing protein [Clostridiales bacterium]|nr:GGDEF domain-containing protein [Clostridiales bacterium]